MTSLLALEGIVLPAMLAVSGVASAFVVALAILAFRRRRSRSYLLVTLALATLLAKPFFGALTLEGILDPDLHHVLEHGMDAVVVVLLLGAVYVARTVERPEEVARD